MERKLRYFEGEIEKIGLELNGADLAASMPAPDEKELQRMESEFEKMEREVN